MPEVLTASVTVVLGFVVFVSGQIAQRFFIEPIQEQKKLIGEVAYALLFYANVVHPDSFGPPDERRREELDEARKTLRGLAGRLQASLWTVPFYDALARLDRVPKKEDVLVASANLVGWSNSLYGRGSNAERQKAIADRLGITKRLNTP